MSERAGRKVFEEVSLYEGKYIFRLNLDNWHLTCLRHGEAWREFVGDKAVHALFDKAFEVEELKGQIKQLKVEKEDQRQRAAEWEEYYMREKAKCQFFEYKFSNPAEMLRDYENSLSSFLPKEEG